MWGKFDTFGHIPTPMRYMRDRDGQSVSLDRYQDQIREIPKIIIEKGRGIEVNTKNWSARIRQDTDHFALMSTLSGAGRRDRHRGQRRPLPEYVGTHILRSMKCCGRSASAM